MARAQKKSGRVGTINELEEHTVTTSTSVNVCLIEYLAQPKSRYGVDS